MIAEIVPEAAAEARRRQGAGAPRNVVVDGLLSDVAAVVDALAGIPAESSAQVCQWYYDIGVAVASASKGIKPSSRAPRPSPSGARPVGP